MLTPSDMKRKLGEVFEKAQATVLTEVIVEAYGALVKTGDFNELKEIVRELAQAQVRTEARMEELAQAQVRTEARVEELTQAQVRTEARMEELAQAQKATEKEIRVLAKGLTETRGELGGLSRSVSYGLENEAYRMLPKVLSKKYGIELKEKLIRVEIAGKEINVFGRARRNGQDAILVGEVKLRLDHKRKKREEKDVFAELEDKVEAVSEEYGEEQIVRVLITHYATKGFMKKAQDRGVLVVQSFEW